MLTSVKPDYGVVGISGQLRLDYSLNDGKAVGRLQSRHGRSHMEECLLCSKTGQKS